MTIEKLRTKSFDHTGRQWYYKSEVDELLNDLKSRTCENCKDCIIQPSGVYDCQFLNCITNKDFGCNKFERKEDEMDRM